MYRKLVIVLALALFPNNLGAQEIGFDLQIANPFTSIFRLENTSTETTARIFGFSAFIGDTTYNFDIVGNEQILFDTGDPLNSTLVVGDDQQGGVRTDDLAYEFTGFEIGDRFQFSVDLDLDTGDSGADLREIYFNNGDAVPNALLAVDFEFSGQTRRLELLLPDDPLVGDPQVFDFSVSQSVPEPSTAILLLAVSVVGICTRRKIAR